MLYTFAPTFPRATSLLGASAHPEHPGHHQSCVCVIRGQAARQHFVLTVVVAFSSLGSVFLALRPVPIVRSGRGTHGAESRGGSLYRRRRRATRRAPRARRGLGERGSERSERESDGGRARIRLVRLGDRTATPVGRPMRMGRVCGSLGGQLDRTRRSGEGREIGDVMSFAQGSMDPGCPL